MPEDQVACRLCSHAGATLARHLKAVHGITADEYRQQFPDARIRSETCEANRRAAIVKAHADKPKAGLKKTIECFSCGEPHEVGFTFSSTDRRCPACKARDAETLWAAKVENDDYVTCCVCGHRAESLVSHIRSVHPELEGHYSATFPGALVVARNSDIRDKSLLVGRKHTPETIAKMQANAGRWNKGLTKTTDERVSSGATNMVGRAAWSTGQTKATDVRLRQTAQTVAEVRATKHWNSGNEVTLTREQLVPFALKNGKISVGRAIAAMGHAFVTIKRECEKHGLPISHTAIQQAICLEIIAQAMGGITYETEWNDGSFINPKTGGRFRFDGFFSTVSLLVEFHGHQHYTPDSVWFFDGGETYEELVWRDQEKVRQVKADGRFKLLVVREDQPYTDAVYLRKCYQEIEAP